MAKSTIIVNLSNFNQQSLLGPLATQTMNTARVISELAWLKTVHGLTAVPLYFSWLNYLVDFCTLAKQYSSFKKIIDDYKEAKKTTDEFFTALLTQLDGLATANYSEKDKDDFFEHRTEFLTLKSISEKDQLTPELMAKASLEKAWNTHIRINQNGIDEFNRLLEYAKQNNCDICIVSNTNAPHVKESFFLLLGTTTVKDVNFDPGLTQRSILVGTTGTTLIECYPSYTFGVYKTTGLIEKIMAAKGASQYFVISQWTPDLDAAKKIPETRTDVSVKTFSSVSAFLLPEPVLQTAPQLEMA